MSKKGSTDKQQRRFVVCAIPKSPEALRAFGDSSHPDVVSIDELSAEISAVLEKLPDGWAIEVLSQDEVSWL